MYCFTMIIHAHIFQIQRPSAKRRKITRLNRLSSRISSDIVAKKCTVSIVKKKIKKRAVLLTDSSSSESAVPSPHIITEVIYEDVDGKLKVVPDNKLESHPTNLPLKSSNCSSSDSVKSVSNTKKRKSSEKASANSRTLRKTPGNSKWVPVSSLDQPRGSHDWGDSIDDKSTELSKCSKSVAVNAVKRLLHLKKSVKPAKRTNRLSEVSFNSVENPEKSSTESKTTKQDEGGTVKRPVNAVLPIHHETIYPSPPPLQMSPLIKPMTQRLPTYSMPPLIAPKDVTSISVVKPTNVTPPLRIPREAAIPTLPPLMKARNQVQNVSVIESSVPHTIAPNGLSSAMAAIVPSTSCDTEPINSNEQLYSVPYIPDPQPKSEGHSSHVIEPATLPSQTLVNGISQEQLQTLYLQLYNFLQENREQNSPVINNQVVYDLIRFGSEQLMKLSSSAEVPSSSNGQTGTETTSTASPCELSSRLLISADEKSQQSPKTVTNSSEISIPVVTASPCPNENYVVSGASLRELDSSISVEEGICENNGKESSPAQDLSGPSDFNEVTSATNLKNDSNKSKVIKIQPDSNTRSITDSNNKPSCKNINTETESETAKLTQDNQTPLNNTIITELSAPFTEETSSPQNDLCDVNSDFQKDYCEGDDNEFARVMVESDLGGNMCPNPTAATDEREEQECSEKSKTNYSNLSNVVHYKPLSTDTEHIIQKIEPNIANVLPYEDTFINSELCIVSDLSEDTRNPKNCSNFSESADYLTSNDLSTNKDESKLLADSIMTKANANDKPNNLDLGGPVCHDDSSCDFVEGMLFVNKELEANETSASLTGSTLESTEQLKTMTGNKMSGDKNKTDGIIDSNIESAISVEMENAGDNNIENILKQPFSVEKTEKADINAPVNNRGKENVVRNSEEIEIEIPVTDFLSDRNDSKTKSYETEFQASAKDEIKDLDSLSIDNNLQFKNIDVTDSSYTRNPKENNRSTVSISAHASTVSINNPNKNKRIQTSPKIFKITETNTVIINQRRTVDVVRITDHQHAKQTDPSSGVDLPFHFAPVSSNNTTPLPLTHPPVLSSCSAIDESISQGSCQPSLSDMTGKSQPKLGQTIAIQKQTTCTSPARTGKRRRSPDQRRSWSYKLCEIEDNPQDKSYKISKLTHREYTNSVNVQIMKSDAHLGLEIPVTCTNSASAQSATISKCSYSKDNDMMMPSSETSCSNEMKDNDMMIPSSETSCGNELNQKVSRSKRLRHIRSNNCSSETHNPVYAMSVPLKNDQITTACSQHNSSITYSQHFPISASFAPPSSLSLSTNSNLPCAKQGAVHEVMVSCDETNDTNKQSTCQYIQSTESSCSVSHIANSPSLHENESTKVDLQSSCIYSKKPSASPKFDCKYITVPVRSISSANDNPLGSSSSQPVLQNDVNINSSCEDNKLTPGFKNSPGKLSKTKTFTIFDNYSSLFDSDDEERHGTASQEPASDLTWDVIQSTIEDPNSPAVHTPPIIHKNVYSSKTVSSSGDFATGKVSQSCSVASRLITKSLESSSVISRVEPIKDTNIQFNGEKQQNSSGLLNSPLLTPASLPIKSLKVSSNVLPLPHPVFFNEPCSPPTPIDCSPITTPVTPSTPEILPKFGTPCEAVKFLSANKNERRKSDSETYQPGTNTTDEIGSVDSYFEDFQGNSVLDKSESKQGDLTTSNSAKKLDTRNSTETQQCTDATTVSENTTRTEISRRNTLDNSLVVPDKSIAASSYSIPVPDKMIAVLDKNTALPGKSISASGNGLTNILNTAQLIKRLYLNQVVTSASARCLSEQAISAAAISTLDGNLLHKLLLATLLHGYISSAVAKSVQAASATNNDNLDKVGDLLNLNERLFTYYVTSVQQKFADFNPPPPKKMDKVAVAKRSSGKKYQKFATFTLPLYPFQPLIFKKWTKWQVTKSPPFIIVSIATHSLLAAVVICVRSCIRLLVDLNLS